MKTGILNRCCLAARMFLEDPKAFYRRMRSQSEDPLFLFQFGKVASRTVATTLEPYYHVRHSHIESVFNSQFEALGLQRGKGHKGAPIPLISITRDPLAREFSSFFQNISNPGHKYHFGSREEVLGTSPDELLHFYMKDLEKNLYYILNWFDIKFKVGTEVDVYAHEFDRERGWSLFEDGGFQVLLLRYEDIKSNFVPALNALLEFRRKGPVEIRRLTSSNLSGEKWYQDVMGEVRKRLAYDSQILDSVYDSKFCRHFYSNEELANMKVKWTDNRA